MFESNTRAYARVYTMDLHGLVSHARDTFARYAAVRTMLRAEERATQHPPSVSGAPRHEAPTHLRVR